MGEEQRRSHKVPIIDEDGHTIEITYTYNLGTKEGKIINWQRDVMVDSKTLTMGDPQLFSSTNSTAQKAFSHPHFLRVLLVDEKEKNIIYEKFDKTLAQWLDNQTALADKALISFPVYRPGTKEKSGDYTISNPRRRKLAKALMKFIFDLHKKRFATTGFNMDNIVVLNGEIKVWEIGLLDAKKRDHVKSDYSKLLPIMKRLFHDTNGDHQGYLPYDVQNFLDIVHYCATESSEHSHLLIHHVALKSPKERLQPLIKVQERKRLVLESRLAGSFRRSMTRAGNKWTNQDIKRQYQVGGVLGDSPIGAVFQFSSRQEGDEIIYGYKFDGRNPFKLAEDFVRFLRNLAVHLFEYASSSLSKNECAQVIDAIIYCSFGRIVCDLQVEMFLQGVDLLEYFFDSDSVN